MKLNKIAVVLLTVLAISFSLPAFTVQTAPTSEFQPEAYDVGPKLRDRSYSPELNLEFDPNGLETTGYSGGGTWPTIYDSKLMLYYDDHPIYGGLFVDLYHLVNYTDTTEIWMQHDFNYYAGFDPEPRNPVEITEEQLDYFVTEFDTNILPTVTEFYGVPDFHNGSASVLGPMLGEDYYNEDGRIIIQISNIGDEFYYDPSFPSFIAGFYWGTYEYYMDRNIINIDADFWETHLYPTETGTGFVGTTAHELQHLIHADYNPDDDTFMNEGCSTYAEYLCGYGVPWGDINWYMATPDNSLIIWGDQGSYNILADYGVVFLWAMYIQDRFGPLVPFSGFEDNFLGAFVQWGIPGIEGLNLWFEFLSGSDFDGVYHDWRIANLIDTETIGGGKYSYLSIDLSNADPPRQYDIKVKDFMYGTDLGTTLTILGYDTGISMLGMYGSDYIRFDHLSKDRKGKLFLFDGDDGVALWTLTEYGWYSGSYNMGNALLYGTATIDFDSILTITTWYNIEDYWDFGFVQVSLDDGETWISLENFYTTDYYETNLPEISDNMPGLTGYSGGFITMDFELPDYEGDVLIGFRYMTDQFVMYTGWYVDNVMVDGNAIELTPELTPMDFQVTLVYYKKARGYRTLEPYKVIDVPCCDAYNIGIKYIDRWTVDIVAIISPVGFGLGYVDYWFGMFALKWGHCH
ncbi:MAG: hypothetical protein ACFE8O_01490 [Candidatus Hermodarchaeota archaeon]